MKQSKLVLLLVGLIILILFAAAADAQSQLVTSQTPQGNAPLPIVQNLELVRHGGGWVHNLSIEGNYAYFGLGSELRVYSLSDPANPTLVGSLILGETIGYVYARNNYLYIGNYRGGYSSQQDNILTIVDVSEPSQPTWLSSVDGFSEIRHIIASDTHVYLSTWSGLDIVDISNEVEPLWVGHFEHNPNYYKFFKKAVLVGGYVYMHDGEKLVVLDVSDPANPVEVYRADIPAFDLALVGDHLYILRKWADFILILDVTNPAAPEEAATYDHTYYQIAVEGDDVYLLDAGFQQVLTILDATEPAQPQLISTSDVAGSYTYSFQVSNGFAYLMYDADGVQIRILDATTPAAPVEANNVYIRRTPFVGNVYVDGDYLYWQWHLLEIFDISDPGNPVFLKEFGLWEPRDIAIHEQFIYYTGKACSDPKNTQCWNYLGVIDATNPLTPTHLGATDGLGFYWPSVEVSGEYAYVWDGGTEPIAVVNVADPNQPALLTYIPSGGSLNDLTISDDYLYTVVFSESRQLNISNLADPTAPVLVGSYAVPIGQASVRVFGSYAYVIDGDSTIYIVDVSNPANPTQVGTYRPPSYLGLGPISGDIVFEDHYAYLSYENRLLMVDITDPANPVHVALYVVGGDGPHAAVKDGFIYLSGNFAGWFAVKSTPVQVALTPGIASSMTYTYDLHLSTHFDFPAASVTEPITIAVNPSTAEDIGGYAFARHTFGLSALQGDAQLPTFTFAAPITLTLHYSHDDVEVISNEAELALWVWTEDGWQDATTTCEEPAPYVRDIINNVLTLTICQTGRFALFGPTNQQYFPVVDRR
jgi:hypothetical protein